MHAPVMRTIGLLALLPALAGCSGGEPEPSPVPVSGTVRERLDLSKEGPHPPLEDARVQVLGEEVDVAVDGSGRFELEAPFGVNAFRATAPGHWPMRQRFRREQLYEGDEAVFRLFSGAVLTDIERYSGRAPDPSKGIVLVRFPTSLGDEESADIDSDYRALLSVGYDGELSGRSALSINDHAFLFTDVEPGEVRITAEYNANPGGTPDPKPCDVGVQSTGSRETWTVEAGTVTLVYARCRFL